MNFKIPDLILANPQYSESTLQDLILAKWHNEHTLRCPTRACPENNLYEYQHLKKRDKAALQDGGGRI